MRKLEDAISIVPELNREDLDKWINDALIEAQQDAGDTVLTDTQFAKVRLICTLRYDLDVDEEILPVVLNLLDQLHETRNRLHNLSQAVLAQDEEIKSSILELLSESKMQQ
jgi:chaperone modulatory protein CbpM